MPKMLHEQCHKLEDEHTDMYIAKLQHKNRKIVVKNVKDFIVSYLSTLQFLSF